MQTEIMKFLHKNDYKSFLKSNLHIKNTCHEEFMWEVTVAVLIQYVLSHPLESWGSENCIRALQPSMINR